MIVSGNRDWDMRPIIWAGKDINVDQALCMVVYDPNWGLCYKQSRGPSAWGAVAIQRCRCLMVVDKIYWLNNVKTQVAITEMVVLGKKI